jgi:hypothetical protein
MRNLALVLLVLSFLGAAAPVHAQRALLITSTEWSFPNQPSECVGAESACHFAAAMEVAQRSSGSATISACFEQGNPRCLQESDPNYDPATGVWTIKLGEQFSGFSVSNDFLVVDFTLNVDGWSSPADNRIAIEVEPFLVQAFIIQASDGQYAGFELKGRFEAAAIVVRTTDNAQQAANNTFGPGLILAGQAEGSGIRWRGSGVTGNKLIGSWCGVRGDGSEVDGLEEFCIEVSEGANENVIGGPEPGDRNTFAGNSGTAIQIGDPASRNNVIEGNNIGTDATGERAAPNHTGVNVVREAEGTKIFGNLISGNEFNGVLMERTSTEFGRIITRVEDNWIGVDRTGERAVPNGACGVEIRGLSKNVVVKNNRIWNNRLCGVTITGDTARNNTITQNSITNNAGHAIEVAPGANEGVGAPTITTATWTQARGTACAGCTVEIFSDPLREAKVWEGTVVAGADGAWLFDRAQRFSLPALTATATDGENTSSLSAAKIITGGTLPSPTPSIPPFGTPTPTATGVVEVWRSIYLPWASQRFVR